MKNKKFLGSIALISMLLAGCGPTTPADTTSSTPTSSSTTDTPDSSSTEVPVEDDEEIVPITTDYTEKSVNRLVALLNAVEDNDYPATAESDDVLIVLSILQKSGFTQEALNQLLNVVDKVVSIAANVQIGLDIENAIDEAISGLKQFLALTNGNQLFHIIHHVLNKVFTINVSLPRIGRLNSAESVKNLMKYLTEAEKATISAFMGYFDFLDTYHQNPSEEEIKNLGDLFYAFLTEALNNITAEDITSLLGEFDPSNITKFVKKVGTIFTNLATNKATILTKAFNSLRGWVNYFVHTFLKNQDLSSDYARLSEIPLGYCLEQQQDIMNNVDTILEKLGEDFFINMNYYLGSLCSNMTDELVGSVMEYGQALMEFFTPIFDDDGNHPKSVKKAKRPDGLNLDVVPINPPALDPSMFIPSTDIIEWFQASFNALPTAVQTSLNNTLKAFTNKTLADILNKTKEFANMDLSVEANQKAMMDYYEGLYDYSLEQFAFQDKLYPIINDYYMEENTIEVYPNSTITEEMVKSALKFVNYDGEYTISVDVSKAKTDKIGLYPLDVKVTGKLIEPKKVELIWENKADDPSEGETQVEPTTHTYRMFYAVISETYTNFHYSVRKKTETDETLDLSSSEDDGIYTDYHNDVIYLPKDEDPLQLVFAISGDMYNTDRSELDWVNTSLDKTIDVSTVGTYATLLKGKYQEHDYIIPVMYRVYDPAKIEKTTFLDNDKIAIIETEYSRVQLELKTKVKLKDFNIEFTSSTLYEDVSFDEPLTPGKHQETFEYNSIEYPYQLLVVPLSDAKIQNVYVNSYYNIALNAPFSDLNLKVGCSATIKADSAYSKICRDENYERNYYTYVNNIDPRFYTVTGFDSSTTGLKTLTITVGDFTYNCNYYVSEMLY